MWRMQSAQDQPLALTVVRSLGATNGKEEEADSGEEAALAAVSVESTLRSKVAVIEAPHASLLSAGSLSLNDFSRQLT